MEFLFGLAVGVVAGCVLAMATMAAKLRADGTGAGTTSLVPPRPPLHLQGCPEWRGWARSAPCAYCDERDAQRAARPPTPVLTTRPPERHAQGTETS